MSVSPILKKIITVSVETQSANTIRILVLYCPYRHNLQYSLMYIMSDIIVTDIVILSVTSLLYCLAQYLFHSKNNILLLSLSQNLHVSNM